MPVFKCQVNCTGFPFYAKKPKLSMVYMQSSPDQASGFLIGVWTVFPKHILEKIDGKKIGISFSSSLNLNLSDSVECWGQFTVLESKFWGKWMENMDFFFCRKLKVSRCHFWRGQYEEYISVFSQEITLIISWMRVGSELKI
jgi:hypothetical protein